MILTHDEKETRKNPIKRGFKKKGKPVSVLD
jgi:hypothetical protein